MDEITQVVLDGFRDAAVKQTPVLVALIAGFVVASIGAVFNLLRKLGKTAAAIAEAKLDVLFAEAHQQRIAVLASVRIVEAVTSPRLPIRGADKKQLAIAHAADLLGHPVPDLPHLVQVAWQAEHERDSYAGDDTPAETPDAKRHQS